MQFSMSSISVRTPERMQFGKRADHQPLRSTVKRTLKCGAGSFRPTLSTLLFVPKRARNGDGAGPTPKTPGLRLRASGARGASRVPSRTDYLSVGPGPYCTMWLRSNAPAVRAGALLERDPVADRVPRATNGKPCGANIKCPRCEGSLPRCEA